MKENKLSIFIDKPVNVVFEYSLESNNVPKWILSIKEEIPLERPVGKGTKLKNIGVNSSTWNEYEVMDFQPNKTFKRLNGDYFVKYTCTEKDNGTDFEYLEWAENGELDDLMEISALELLKKNIEELRELKVTGIYRHYKGDLYLVEDIIYHSETGEKMVAYRALYGDNTLWCRPYDMFLDIVNKNGQKYRFELQNIKSVKE